MSLAALHIAHLHSKTIVSSCAPIRLSVYGNGHDMNVQDGMVASPAGPSTYPLNLEPGSSDSEPSSLLALAYSNQISASSSFRYSISTVDADNWFPVMAFVVATLVFRLETCRRATTFCGLVTDSLAAFRTAAIAGEEIKPFFQGSVFFRSFLMRQTQKSATVLDPELVLAIAFLKALNDGRELIATVELEDQILCAQAIEALQRWVLFVSGKPRTWLHYVWWPADVPHRFIEMINEKRPGPLLVFVHWCVIMNQETQRWFLDGWARKAAAVVAVEMGSGWWDPGLEWPSCKLGLQ
ncbi:Fc.00g045610.m01.CDS01 [Cosmosporella sp. VM-42]